MLARMEIYYTYYAVLVCVDVISEYRNGVRERTGLCNALRVRIISFCLVLIGLVDDGEIELYGVDALLAVSEAVAVIVRLYAADLIRRSITLDITSVGEVSEDRYCRYRRITE